MPSLEDVLRDASWLNEPPAWALTEEELTLTTGSRTDFWQDTYYGFRRDDGHFLGRAQPGDFTAAIAFEAAYEVLYDQAGLMMRTDAQNWLKAGIEFSDDVTNFSTVVTRDGRSDWSVIGVPHISGPQKIRLTRQGGAVLVHFLGQGKTWTLMRLADYPADQSVRVGPMACSPERTGLDVRFLGMEIGPPARNALHGN
ncbi:MAG: DUF1349 domain-containing protein [Pseudomonadota bacterium]